MPSGRTIAKTSYFLASLPFFEQYILPCSERYAVLTSTLANVPFCKIARSQGQFGLTALNTANFFLRRSAQTTISDIAPTVPAERPVEAELLPVFMRSRTFLHSDEQYRCLRHCLPLLIIALPQTQHKSNSLSIGLECANSRLLSSRLGA